MKGVIRTISAAIVAGLIAVPALAADRQDITIAVQSNPTSLDPAYLFSNVAWRVTHNVFDTLIVSDPNDGFRLKPGLATSWKRVDDRTLELKLRDNVKFHDGSVLSAEDVVFTFGPERMSAKDAPVWGQTRQYLGVVESVEAVDGKTIRVRTTQPDPIIEYRLATLAAAIVSKSAYEKASNFDAWGASPVGTGPYKISRFVTNDYVDLVAFDEYWGGKPNVGSVRFHVVPEVATRVAALQSGNADIATDLPLDQKQVIEKDEALKFVGGSIENIRVLVFDTTNPILKDPRVRKAIGLGIDRRAITSGLWDGLVDVPNGHQSPSYGDLWIKEWPEPAYDPEAAKKLLAEAGYKGEPIEYRAYNNYYTNELVTAQALVEMWKAIGLNVRLVVKENTQQIYDPEGRGIRNWSNTIAYPDPLGGLWRLYGERGPVQLTSKEWTNAEFNAAGRVLESSLDLNERREAHRKMMSIYDNEDPFGTILHFNGMFYGMKKSVEWRPLPVEFMELRPGNLSFAK